MQHKLGFIFQVRQFSFCRTAFYLQYRKTSFRKQNMHGNGEKADIQQACTFRFISLPFLLPLLHTAICSFHTTVLLHGKLKQFQCPLIEKLCMQKSSFFHFFSLSLYFE